MPQPSARDRFLDLLRTALSGEALIKLTLAKPRVADPTLRNLFVRPVALKAGPHLAFLWRHATRDLTKNIPAAEAFAALEPLIGHDFLDAHLFTATQNAQLETQPDGSARLKLTRAPTTNATPLASSPTSGSSTPSAHTASSSQLSASPPAPTPVALAPIRPPAAHDRKKSHLIPADAPWLHALGVVNDRGHPREGMADKFRQIQKFAELLTHLLADANLPADRPLRIVDMGSGKGYLTFALAHLLGSRAVVRGIEFRPELVELCNRIAREQNLSDHLSFSAGTIVDASLPPGECDVLIALHACDTATDDALARGLAAGARLLVVAPCCQKELRPQLTAPPILADALRHGIFQERQSEFVTDALRAQLLEAAGFRTKVFEFISTEHTAKNVMIAATKLRDDTTPDPVVVERLRAFAAFYGIRHQRLATHLGVPFSSGT